MQRDRREQDDERRRARQQSAGHPDGNERAVGRMLMVMSVRVCARVPEARREHGEADRHHEQA